MLYNYLGADNKVRCIGVDSSEVLKEAARIHTMSNEATALLGRTLTGALILTRHLKNQNDILTLQLKGKGPLGGVIAVTTVDCKVKGYVDNPLATMPLNNGKLDVGGGLGRGTLTVIKDLGLKEPYIGTVPLISGEVAEDLSYYLAVSEQIPSVVSLGVLVKNSEVIVSGGFMIQPLPNADEEVLSKLEERVSTFPPVSKLLSAGATIEEIMFDFMNGFSMEKIEEVETHYSCDCNRDRISSVLASLGKNEINEMIEDGKGAEVKCHFCNTDYIFNTEELINIRDQI